MRFSKLRLNGFKSFVDPTDLIIADGLTGVVGPNGCGKSNLLEAMRWVMGENRPTAMRGGGMEDVIFAGAATRPARNFAEVSLLIDNGERLAPAGFNDQDTLEVVRRITRDIGSAYKANTKDVRARDVQMLFADASTGAHSPALVRQGQISELINAKPKARRRILEEAAGISGLYQRRHEAELKLNGAETNLGRVDDVLDQLTQQLTTLARQAKQASRYRELGTALRLAEGVLLYRRWKEADDAQAAAADALRAATIAASQAEGAARAAGTTRAECEAALPPLREDEAVANAVLQRLKVERDNLTDQEDRAAQAITTLEARIAQLSADLDREGDLNKDAGSTVDRLRAEEAELAKDADGHDDRLAKASAEASEAAAVLHDRESQLAQVTEDVARLAARYQSAQRFLDDAQKRLERAATEEQNARNAIEAAANAAGIAAGAVDAAKAQETAAAQTVELADQTLQESEAARTACQAQEDTARARMAEADGVVSALQAEVSALQKLVDRGTNDTGQILDAVQVAPGYEKALGAALADDLKLPIVRDGALSGWVEIANYPTPLRLPEGATPLGTVATAPGVMDRRMAQVGVVDAADGARLQPQLMPGQRLVSKAGDLWRWDGFCMTADDAPSTAALRLEQRNRLADLSEQLDAANQAAAGSRSKHEQVAARLAQLTQADRDARAARREAEQQLAGAARALSKAEAERNVAQGKQESLTLSLNRFAEEATEARSQAKDAQTTLDGLEDLDAVRALAEDVKMTVEASRVTMLSKRSGQEELRRVGDARAKRSADVARDIKRWEERLANASSRSQELESRKVKATEELKAAKLVPGTLVKTREDMLVALEAAEKRRQLAADALAVAETALREAVQTERDAERGASEAREERARGEARSEAAAEAVLQAASRIEEEMETTPIDLLDSLDVDPNTMMSADTAEVEVAKLRRGRDALGAVNLRAEEDARAVQEEHDTLAGEKVDLEDAIKTLRSGIASLNKEGRERLLAAFDEVNKNFGTLFTHLFGGGEASLVMVESDDPLEAGLEIMCQPPGKKLSTLSLLSGGEQTLTALALIFAVFLANPAPICVLDEVDAPLDDANVGRFCDLLDEMTRRTQTRFLIITHHAVTMSRMDRLFGVTMAEQGVSQLVSVDLKKAEQMVA